MSIPSPIDAFQAVVLLYRRIFEADWQPVNDDRPGSSTTFRMRRWRNGKFEYRNCTPEEETEASWNKIGP